MSVLDGLGRYIDSIGLGRWLDTGTYADGDVALMLERIPQTPDRAIALTLYAGNTVPSKGSVDEPRVQLRIRGTTDPSWSRGRAEDLYNALNGLTNTTLPDGTHLVLAYATGYPAYMGRDNNERHEHVVNLACSITNPHRLE